MSEISTTQSRFIICHRFNEDKEILININSIDLVDSDASGRATIIIGTMAITLKESFEDVKAKMKRVNASPSDPGDSPLDFSKTQRR